VRALRGPRGGLSRWLLFVGQGYAAHVDDAVFHFQRVLALLLTTFLEVGQRLARKGAVERAEDVFYLEQAELWAPPVDLATWVTQRYLLRESQKRLAPPPFIPPLSDPAWAKDLQIDHARVPGATMMFGRGMQERDGRRVLVGAPGSPGRARGTARIIAGLGDFPRFQSGDVLVAHTTTPIWTPLFSMASAAVTEVGGPMSHAAIVARKFGIPLVNGALDATQVIVDGMPIVVDGSAGIVEL
jgi:rifampicin phosphotransferase